MKETKEEYYITKGKFYRGSQWYKYSAIRIEKDGNSSPIYFNKLKEFKNNKGIK